MERQTELGEDVAQLASRPRNARYFSYLFRHINNPAAGMGTSDIRHPVDTSN